MYPETKAKKAASCSFCGRVLGREYYFTCHICGATYCYIHMYRHVRAHNFQQQQTNATTSSTTAAMGGTTTPFIEQD